MAPIITEPKKLSMPQQVEKNREDIKKVWDYLDGISLDDKLVVVNTETGTMTSAELEILRKPLAFISLGGSTVFVKTTTDDNDRFVFVSFEFARQTIGNAYIKLGIVSIHVNMITGAYETLVDNIIDTYNKTQVDSIIANIMTLLDGKASLTGATFSGGIAAPNVLEIMTGYTFTPSSNPKVTTSFAGIAKTGNKITFAIAGSIVCDGTETAGTGFNIGSFTMPNSVGEKLIPNTGERIGYRPFKICNNAYDGLNCQTCYVKNNNTSGYFYVFTSANAEAKTYYFRFEETFLLGENLAQ